MWGIGVEWWILYGILVLLLVSVLVISSSTDTHKKAQYYGLGMLHEDLEKIMRILDNKRG